MLDELKEEEIVNMVGGRFKLSTLIQKRLVALNTGAKPLVNAKSADKMAIAPRKRASPAPITPRLRSAITAKKTTSRTSNAINKCAIYTRPDAHARDGFKLRSRL